MPCLVSFYKSFFFWDLAYSYYSDFFFLNKKKPGWEKGFRKVLLSHVLSEMTIDARLIINHPFLSSFHGTILISELAAQVLTPYLQRKQL